MNPHSVPTNHPLQKTLVHFEQVSFAYYKTHHEQEQKWVLKNFNATIYQNSLTLLKGENGSGKSTLLKLLVNSTKPGLVSGKIEKYYQPQQVGYLSQQIQHGVKFPLTVLEFLRIQQPTLKKNDQKLKALLEQFNLWGIRHQNFSELSGGQKQKTYILRTLLMSSEIILMDEPFSYLDQKAEKSFAQLIKNLLLAKATIIMAIHDDNWLTHLAEDIKKTHHINTLELK